MNYTSNKTSIHPSNIVYIENLKSLQKQYKINKELLNSNTLIVAKEKNNYALFYIDNEHKIQRISYVYDFKNGFQLDQLYNIIINFDNVTIKKNDKGELYVETENLRKATYDQRGIIKGDNMMYEDPFYTNSTFDQIGSVVSQNGIISLNSFILSELNDIQYYYEQSQLLVNNINTIESSLESGHTFEVGDILYRNKTTYTLTFQDYGLRDIYEPYMICIIASNTHPDTYPRFIPIVNNISYGFHYIKDTNVKVKAKQLYNSVPVFNKNLEDINTYTTTISNSYGYLASNLGIWASNFQNPLNNNEHYFANLNTDLTEEVQLYYDGQKVNENGLYTLGPEAIFTDPNYRYPSEYAGTYVELKFTTQWEDSYKGNYNTLLYYVSDGPFVGTFVNRDPIYPIGMEEHNNSYLNLNSNTILFIIEKWRCPECGTYNYYNRSGISICSNCEHSHTTGDIEEEINGNLITVESFITCPKCRKTVQVANTCSNCGHDLSQYETVKTSRLPNSIITPEDEEDPSGEDPSGNEELQDITSVTISGPTTISVGETKIYSLDISPTNYKPETFTWTITKTTNGSLEVENATISVSEDTLSCTVTGKILTLENYPITLTVTCDNTSLGLESQSKQITVIQNMSSKTPQKYGLTVSKNHIEELKKEISRRQQAKDIVPQQLQRYIQSDENVGLDSFNTNIYGQREVEVYKIMNNIDLYEYEYMYSNDIYYGCGGGCGGGCGMACSCAGKCWSQCTCDGQCSSQCSGHCSNNEVIVHGTYYPTYYYTLHMLPELSNLDYTYIKVFFSDTKNYIENNYKSLIYQKLDTYLTSTTYSLNTGGHVLIMAYMDKYYNDRYPTIIEATYTNIVTENYNNIYGINPNLNPIEGDITYVKFYKIFTVNTNFDMDKNMYVPQWMHKRETGTGIVKYMKDDIEFIVDGTLIYYSLQWFAIYIDSEDHHTKAYERFIEINYMDTNSIIITSDSTVTATVEFIYITNNQDTDIITKEIEFSPHDYKGLGWLQSNPLDIDGWFKDITKKPDAIKITNMTIKDKNNEEVILTLPTENINFQGKGEIN